MNRVCVSKKRFTHQVGDQREPSMILVIYGTPADKIGPEGIATRLVENPLALRSCGIYSDTVIATFQVFPGFVTVMVFLVIRLF